LRQSCLFDVIDKSAALEQGVLAHLDASGVEYEVIPCAPELADTANFCAHYGYALDHSANTIVVAARREPGLACACVVLASTRLDVNHKVCELLGVRRASFAGAEQTREITGMMLGGVTPFTLPAAVPVYVDAAVMGRQWVIVGGGSRAMKLRLSPGALLAASGARVVEGLAGPAPEPNQS
jgi:prolyl-tRNA editing enzyme YbaK/EbsC (Cys-tRNA(Pro) deacylase)